MINLSALKRALGKYKKKINRGNLQLIKKYSEEALSSFLGEIAKEADYGGRKTIRKEDIKRVFEKREERYPKWEV